MRQEYPFDVGWEQSETLECGSGKNVVRLAVWEKMSQQHSQASENKAPGAEEYRSSLSDGFIVFMEIM